MINATLFVSFALLAVSHILHVLWVNRQVRELNIALLNKGVDRLKELQILLDITGEVIDGLEKAKQLRNVDCHARMSKQ